MRRSPARSESRASRLAAFLATPRGRRLGKAGIAALGVLALALVMRQARASAQRMDAYRLRSEDVVFTDLPASVDPEMRGGLRAWMPAVWPVGAPPSTFSPGLEPRLRDLMAHHPMVREVVDVEVRFPREVRVRAVVRTPLAAFRTRLGVADGRVVEADVPVDGEGVVLDPTTYATFMASHDVVRVLGVRAGCPVVGRPWLDSEEQVEEGLAAARVGNRLNAERPSARVPRVVAADVSAFPASPALRARGEVLLVLEDGRIVQWGRTERDLASAPHEDSYETKRDRLADLLAVPASRGFRELDVRYPTAPAARFAPSGR